MKKQFLSRKILQMLTVNCTENIAHTKRIYHFSENLQNRVRIQLRVSCIKFVIVLYWNLLRALESCSNVQPFLRSLLTGRNSVHVTKIGSIALIDPGKYR